MEGSKSSKSSKSSKIAHQTDDDKITIEEAVSQIWDFLEVMDRKLNRILKVKAVMDKIEAIESNAQLRDNALRESFGTSFEKIWDYLAGINMKQMDIKAYSKRIEDKLDRLLKGKDNVV